MVGEKDEPGLANVRYARTDGLQVGPIERPIIDRQDPGREPFGRLLACCSAHLLPASVITEVSANKENGHGLGELHRDMLDASTCQVWANCGTRRPRSMARKITAQDSHGADEWCEPG
jgi:hypothetical protein